MLQYLVQICIVGAAFFQARQNDEMEPAQEKATTWKRFNRSHWWAFVFVVLATMVGFYLQNEKDKQADNATNELMETQKELQLMQVRFEEEMDKRLGEILRRATR